MRQGYYHRQLAYASIVIFINTSETISSICKFEVKGPLMRPLGRHTGESLVLALLLGNNRRAKAPYLEVKSLTGSNVINSGSSIINVQ